MLIINITFGYETQLDSENLNFKFEQFDIITDFQIKKWMN